VTFEESGLGDLLRQAQAMQERLAEAQAAAADHEVQGHSGGGAVRIVVTGDLEFRAVRIDPRAVDPGDVGMLEDLVLAALHDAVAQLNALGQQAVGSSLGGLDLGGLDLGGFDLGGLDLEQLGDALGLPPGLEDLDGPSADDDGEGSDEPRHP